MKKYTLQKIEQELSKAGWFKKIFPELRGLVFYFLTDPSILASDEKVYSPGEKLPSSDYWVIRTMDDFVGGLSAWRFVSGSLAQEILLEKEK
jgi:hypothetical protein